MTLQAVVLPLVSLVVLFLPGLVVGLLAGLRPGVAAAVAPVVTYGLVTATATAAGLGPVPWGPLTLVAVTALTGGVVLALRLATGRDRPWRARVRVQRPRRPGRRDLLVLAGVLGGGLLSAGVLLSGFGRLDAPDQDWDYIFHANAVRLIADSGDIAPDALRQINNWESASFYYPNAFPAVAAVVRDLTGAPVFAVLNSQAMIVCLVAGTGLATLLRRLGAPLAVVVTTPVLLAGFASFPYDVLWRGPLLPFAAGVAAIPAFVVLLDLTVARRRPVLVFLCGLGLAGLLGVHPATALSAAVFAAVVLLVRWWRAPRTLGADLVPLAAVGVLATVIAFPAVVGARTTGAEGIEIDWPAIESPGQAAGDLLLLNHMAVAPQYWLAGLVLVGLLTVARARYLWAWLGGAGLMFALFVMTASSDSPLVATVTRPWWNDRWRFAALAVLGLAPLAAHGLLSLARFGQRLLARLPFARQRGLPAPVVTGALVGVGLLLVGSASNGLYSSSNQRRIAENYDSERTLSNTEIAAMRWLGEHSTGGTIMDDANDGSAYLRAVAGLHPLFGHVVDPSSVRLGPTQKLLVEHFNCLDSDPAVRRAVHDLDIRYVFVSDGYVRPGFQRLPGLTGLENSPSLRLVHSAGPVRIYEVALVEPPTAPNAACRSTGDGAVVGASG